MESRETSDGYRPNYPMYEAYVESLKTLCSQVISAAGIAVDTVTGRAKDPDHLTEKMARKAHYASWREVPDLAGIRVVTRYRGDVDRVCDLLSRELLVSEDVTHGSDEADAFGYASRHLVVSVAEPRSTLTEWANFDGLRAEIQVRSILQHSWASISHSLDYKTDSAVPEQLRRQLFRVAALLETGDELFDDFRFKVEELQGEYRAEVSRDDWRTLPLNLDSLTAAWDEMPVQELEDKAAAAGWILPTSSEREANQIGFPIFAARLIPVMLAAGCDTVGDVNDIMSEALKDEGWLRRLGDAGQTDGYRPYAVASDVATLRALSKFADRDAVMAEGRKSTLRTGLVEAAGRTPPTEGS